MATHIDADVEAADEDSSTGSTTESRMRRQKLEIQLEIRKVGLDLFAKYGFDATTVNDIVAQTSISRRTFFRYFASKEDIIFSWVDEEAHAAWPLLLDPTEQECPMAMLRESFLRLANRHTGELDNLRRMMSLIFTTPSLRGRFYNVTAGWQTRLYENWQEAFGGDREGFFRLRVQTAAAIAAYLTALQTWVADGSGVPLTTLVSQAFENFITEGSADSSKAGTVLSRKSSQPSKNRLQIVTD